MRAMRMSAAVCAALMVATIAGSGVTVAAGGNPVLVRGKKAGPILIAKRARTFGSLPLTKGRWLVMAKAVVAGTGGKAGAYLGVDCKLALGGRADLVSAVPRRQGGAGSRVAILLTTAGKLKRSGRAKLRCWADVGGAVRIRDIQMTAIRVGRLTTRATVSAAATPSGTSGSGKPRVISARQPSARIVKGDGDWHEVTRLPLAAGRWWIIAKGIADGGGASDSYECRIVAASASGGVGFPLGAPGTAGDTRPFALQLAAVLGSAGPAAVVCRGKADFRVRRIVINAIRIGTQTIEPQPTLTFGSGKPRATSWVDDGPLPVPVGGDLKPVFTSSLPKGKWLVFATATFIADDIPDQAVRRAICQLVFSGFKDVVELRYADTLDRIGSMVMQVPTDTSGSPKVVLRCRRSPGGGDGDVVGLTISALKLKRITAWKI